ncbi:hypothetical protein [Streptomyces albidus (ex Kaewkla and Franco 2022)]|uniref:hypothetical protein n=1 Tax=Streptomyces albidus (ex Kaewkla and Franco 2022) TaxID=722709 RepID=UPI0015EE8A55|nr:hypothetical protein [Streptomyces albidus (ex Kaewkla and Franco 2022)]
MDEELESHMSNDTRRRTRITVAAVLLLAGAIAVPVANGAVTDQEGGDAKGQGKHCTLNAKTGETQCFESLSKATGLPDSDRLLDAPDAEAGKAAKTSEARAGDEPVASSGIDTKAEGDIIAATIFKNTKYGGGSLTITNTALCESDDEVDFQIDLDESWKNKVSSIQPWGRCTLNLFSEPGLGGERDGPFDELTPNIGDAMDNRAQSISFS